VSGLEDWWQHTVDVRTYAGTGAYGDVYETHNGIACWVEETRKWVRSATGEQIVSESQVFTDTANYDWFKPDSEVTIREGQPKSKVITRSLHDSGDLDLPDHVEIALT
jgi:hypothetical protein